MSQDPRDHRPSTSGQPSNRGGGRNVYRNSSPETNSDSVHNDGYRPPNRLRRLLPRLPIWGNRPQHQPRLHPQRAASPPSSRGSSPPSDTEYREFENNTHDEPNEPSNSSSISDILLWICRTLKLGFGKVIGLLSDIKELLIIGFLQKKTNEREGRESPTSEDLPENYYRYFWNQNEWGEEVEISAEQHVHLLRTAFLRRRIELALRELRKYYQGDFY